MEAGATKPELFKALKYTFLLLDACHATPCNTICVKCVATDRWDILKTLNRTKSHYVVRVDRKQVPRISSLHECATHKYSRV